MNLDINKLIDRRNTSLWNEVNSKYNVQVLPSSNNEYSCYTESNNVTFYIPEHDLSPDSMTHELLHVYMKLKEIFIGANLILRISGSRILSKIFDTPLLEHVGNSLDHIKMLPIYVQLGLQREKFILDYYDNKCTENEINLIKANYNNGKRYNSNAINLFIGKYFAMIADPNENADYKDKLAKLAKIDGMLFSVLQNFVIQWKAFDIEDNNPLNSYHSLTETLYTDLKKWMTGKEII